MAENLVKRQHYVPRTYLKHFAEADGKEFLINALPSKATEKEKIFKANISKLALENDLYTLQGETIEQKMAVEKFYSNELEVHYDNIYNILTDPKKIKITLEERNLIISTVVTMYYRTTKWVNASRDLMSRAFEHAYDLCEQTGLDYFMFEDEKLFIAGKTHKEFTTEFNKMRQPGMILTQLETAFKLIALRVMNDSISVVKIEGENLEFVTSDNPVIAKNMNVQRIFPFDPTNTLELPIDSKHKLILIPECPEQLKNHIFRRTSKTHMAEISKLTTNYSQMENSEKFYVWVKKSIRILFRHKRRI